MPSVDDMDSETHTGSKRSQVYKSQKMTDRGGWIQTRTGRQFFPVDPWPDDIDIRDIAGALARQCRFAGHCLRFYSVAEHSVLLARHVGKSSPDLFLTALLHDASEAYLTDIPRPVKPHLRDYAPMEDRLMRVVAQKFGMLWPLPAAVKSADLAILSDERAQNMAPMKAGASDWGNMLPPLGIRLQFWPPEKAEDEFMAAWSECA